MKLYLAAGRYVGTQVDAKRLDKDFQQVDVPVSKDELIAYLNDLLDARPKTVLNPAPVALDNHSRPLTSAKPFSGSLTDVEEFIQNADHVALGRVTENAILRMGELMRDVPKRDVPVDQSFGRLEANVHGIGPDEAGGPNPDYVEPVEEVDPFT